MSAREQMRSRLQDQLCHDLGAPVMQILERSDVTDLSLLENGELWSCERGEWAAEPFVHYEPDHREAIIGLIANSLRQEATYEHPNIEGELEIGGRRFRVIALMPPMVAYPTIVIRKPAQLIYTLEDYERSGSLSTRYRNLLERAVQRRENILAAGAMSSGKTTFVNALMEQIPGDDKHERVGILEEAFELSAPHLVNKIHLHTTDEISLQKLVRSALRLALTRIIVGEVRGAEALDMLKAWRVGCNGSMATIHSNSAAAALSRLGSLVQEAGVPPQDKLIAEAVQLIVFIETQPGENGNGVQRKVTEIVRVHGINREGQFNLTAA